MSFRPRREWVPPTLRELVANMNGLVETAAREESKSLAAMQQLQPGDARLGDARYDVTRYRAEQQHWRGQLAYWRDLLTRYPQLADKPAAMAVKADAGRVPSREEAPPKPHWSEPRERQPGDDDFEEAQF